MSTIALYASKVNQMPDLIGDIKTSVSNYITELSTLNSKATNINSGVCDLGDVIASINSSTVTQEDLKDTLDTFYQNSENFISAVDSIDGAVADAVNQSKDDFYEDYSYLKPDCEKTTGEKIVDALVEFVVTSVVAYINVQMDVAAWCKEHWVEILITVVIVVGAILAIAAVIATGGAALVPLLAAGFGAMGLSAGTAMTVATCISLTIAVIAISSTFASSVMNIMDIWGDYSDNPTFQSWKNTMNWISGISNLIYGGAGIYNSLSNISSSSLKAYGASFIKTIFAKDGLRSALWNAKNFPVKFDPNTSLFWGGLGQTGETISSTYAANNGLKTLGQVLDELGIARPTTNAGWAQASASMALKTSGNASALLGSEVGKGMIGYNYTFIESVVLNIRPAVTSLTKIGADAIAKAPSFFNLLPTIFGIGGSGLELGGEALYEYTE